MSASLQDLENSPEVIVVQNISKAYPIGLIKNREGRLFVRILKGFISPVLRLISVLSGKGSLLDQKTLWALNGVSFTVKKGEILGIVGRNGAGKSTLLKIMSRITYPTSGSIKIYGRLGSMLELGSAFNPEFSARENIYYQGAIYKRSPKEVDKVFDKIVEFSELHEFIDTQVKRFSSGMVGRLAFAIGVHFESEILLIDEVLSTGDLMFAKKCIQKMKELVSSGKTVIFVSHSVGAIEDICSRALLLHKGKIHADGLPKDIIQEYMRLYNFKDSKQVYTPHQDIQRSLDPRPQ